MNERVRQLVDQLNQRALRERVMLFLAVVAVVLFVADSRFLRPIWDDTQSKRASIAEAEKELQTLQQERKALQQAGRQEVKARLREQLEDTRSELQSRKDSVQGRVGDFITPRRLMDFLEQVLLGPGGSGVTVRKLVTHDAKPLEGAGASESGDQDGDGEGKQAPVLPVLRQEVTVALATDFQTGRAFVSHLGELKWVVQIPELTYVVQEHPDARLEMTLQTFVLREGVAGDG